jgi:hypothetical protein
VISKFMKVFQKLVWRLFKCHCKKILLVLKNWGRDNGKMFVSLNGYQQGCSKLLWKHNFPYELFCFKKLFEYQNIISICYGWVTCSIIFFYYTNGPNLWIHCNGLKQLRNCFMLSSRGFKPSLRVLVIVKCSYVCFHFVWRTPKFLLRPTWGSKYVELRKVGTWSRFRLLALKG